ncbi:MAG: hypothetical protein ACLRPS_02725 [Paraprevotella clara]|uniref:hypothetical protein n=1 Tax=Paraprevotella clara TaxID=454154 RepID=UPI0039A1A570
MSVSGKTQKRMKVDVDFSGLDDFLDEAKDEIKKGMVEVAREGVEYAKATGNYKNHTHNLRSAPGAAVVMDGEIVDMYVPTGPGHEEAKSKTERPSGLRETPEGWNRPCRRHGIRVFCGKQGI